MILFGYQFWTLHVSDRSCWSRFWEWLLQLPQNRRVLHWYDVLAQFTPILGPQCRSATVGWVNPGSVNALKTIVEESPYTTQGTWLEVGPTKVDFCTAADTNIGKDFLAMAKTLIRLVLFHSKIVPWLEKLESALQAVLPLKRCQTAKVFASEKLLCL